MALTVFPIEIPAESLSNPLMCTAAGRIVRIGMPAAWHAAPITFQTVALADTRVAPGDVEYLDLFHVAQAASGGWQPYEVVLPAAVAGSCLLMPPGFGFSISGLKIRSGTRSQPINQAANRQFTVVFESNPH